MLRFVMVIVPCVGVILFAGGCGASDQPVPSKDRFQKTAAPPQWRGPGQPGGPSSGPVAVPNQVATPKASGPSGG